MDAREYTNKLLEAIEEGAVSKDAVIQACLNYMSEDEVKDICIDNDLFGSVWLNSVWPDGCDEEESDEEVDERGEKWK